MITWHVETSDGSRFEYADNEEQMRRQMIEYYNETCRDQDSDDEIPEDATFEEAKDAIEEYENFSYEEVHESCIPRLFDGRERDTILAALRLLQAVRTGRINVERGEEMDAIREIADNDHGDALSLTEIDALCERLNR